MEKRVLVIIVLSLLSIFLLYRSCNDRRESEYWRGRVDVVQQQMDAAIANAKKVEQEKNAEIEKANKEITRLQESEDIHNGNIDSLNGAVAAKEEQLERLETEKADKDLIIANLKEQVVLQKNITLEWKGRYEDQCKITDQWMYKYDAQLAETLSWKNAAETAQKAMTDCVQGMIATRKELSHERAVKRIYQIGTLAALVLGGKELLD